MKIKSFKKLLTLAFASAAAVGSSFGELSDAAIAYTGSSAATITENAGQTLVNFLEGAATVIGAVMLAALALWAAYALVRLVIKALQTGKGR